MDKPASRRRTRPQADGADGEPKAAPASIPLEVYDSPPSALDMPRSAARQGRSSGRGRRGGGQPVVDPMQPRRPAAARGRRPGQSGGGGGLGRGRGGGGRPAPTNNGSVISQRSVPSGQIPPNIAYGLNVVSVALDAGMVKTIYFDQQRHNERTQQLHAQAAEQGVEVRPLQKQGWSKVLPGDLHQGVAALLFELPQVFIEEVVSEAGDDSCILVLDRVQDPQNLGAVLRTAAAAGVDAVVLPKAGGCPVTPAVHKASAGMSLRVRIVEDENLARVLDYLKEQGYWVIGCDSEEGEDATTFEYPHKRVLVMGNEAEGMRRLVKESCDYLVNIPMVTGVESLNISVATAIVLYLAQADLAKAALEAPVAE